MQIHLYNERKKRKITQEEIAHQLGISRNSYGKKERGQLPFTQDEMFTISFMFNMNMSEIFLPRSNQNGYKEKVGI